MYRAEIKVHAFEPEQPASAGRDEYRVARTVEKPKKPVRTGTVLSVTVEAATASDLVAKAQQIMAVGLDGVSADEPGGAAQQ